MFELQSNYSTQLLHHDPPCKKLEGKLRSLFSAQCAHPLKREMGRSHSAVGGRPIQLENPSKDTRKPVQTPSDQLIQAKMFRPFSALTQCFYRGANDKPDATSLFEYSTRPSLVIRTHKITKFFRLREAVSCHDPHFAESFRDRTGEVLPERVPTKR